MATAGMSSIASLACVPVDDNVNFFLCRLFVQCCNVVSIILCFVAVNLSLLCMLIQAKLCVLFLYNFVLTGSVQGCCHDLLVHVMICW